VRVLLINPYCSIAENPTPPLGIAFLAAALEEAGIEVRILDLVVSPYRQERLQSLLQSFSPQLVGVTAVTMTFYDAIEVVREVKKIGPGILTIMGGPHVSFCAAETLKSYPELDLIAIGEGERTLVELAGEASNPANWTSIPGLAFRQKGEVVFTAPRDWLDVNSLPLPARHLLPLGRYRALKTAISMTTSRGCPCRCIFCVGRRMVGSRVRYRDPQKVVDELEYLAKLGFPQINIADDLFTAKKQHCLAICEEIIKRQIKVKWSSFARVDTVSPELLQRMKAAGCTAVSFGVETANAKILRTIIKGITLEKTIAAIQMCVAAGIEPHVSFILGLPGETPESLQETQAFGEKISSLGAAYGFHLLAPFPGTAVRDENEKFDLKILTNDWSQYHANRAIVETATVSRQMLDTIAESWENGINASIQAMRDKIRSGEANAYETWQIENMERFFFLYDLMMKETIEDRGSWLNGVSQPSVEEALATLADRVSAALGKTRQETLGWLREVQQLDGLRLTQTDDGVCWQWHEYL